MGWYAVKQRINEVIDLASMEYFFIAITPDSVGPEW